ncbi:unnamed protein product [Sphenostylis stenocarpa]|uniref:Uncharacterized protein n=1 Tax=Sphenostylis stenocarpa TaxID=92480 RepID=A0AA86VZM7_9FABA|nr:unnamed protein product [Sphenostylis stenocarpa]
MSPPPLKFVDNKEETGDKTKDPISYLIKCSPLEPVLIKLVHLANSGDILIEKRCSDN